MSGVQKGSKLWPIIGLVLSAAVLGLFAGMWLGALTVRDEDGMAGAASVLGYGLLGLLVFIVAAVILARKMERRSVVRLAMITGVIALLGLGWFGWRMASELNKATEQDREERERLRNMKPTSVRFAAGYAGVK